MRSTPARRPHRTPRRTMPRPGRRASGRCRRWRRRPAARGSAPPPRGARPARGAGRRGRPGLARLGPPGVIAGQVERPPGRWRTGVGWALGLAVLAAGTAGPHWGLGPPPPTAPGRDVVVVLDLSRSMLAQDALPSRLGRAKDALRELADAVQARGGHRLGLVVFAGQAAVVCPLTHDYDHFRAKLAAV